MSGDKYGFETLSVHAGAAPDPATGARSAPIYQSSSFVFDDADHAASLFNLQLPGFIYSRLTNPTVAVLEERVAAREDGRGATATSSGHAAQILALFPLMRPGEEIIAASKLYGGSINQMGHTYKKFGWQVQFVEPDDPQNFRRAVTEHTRAVFVETLANPSGVVVDLEAITAIAHDAGVPLVVDNTMATPYLIRPIEWGADIIVPFHDQAPVRKRLVARRGGGRFRQVRLDAKRQVPLADHAGARVSRPDLRRDLRRPRLHAIRARRGPARSVGACLSPMNAWITLQGHRDAAVAYGAPLPQRRASRRVP